MLSLYLKQAFVNSTRHRVGLVVPFAKGASGNIATENCVYMLENLGMSAGISIPAILNVRTRLNDWLPDEPLEGK